MTVACLFRLAVFTATFALSGAVAAAQTAPPAVVQPSPSPTPGLSDPCGSILSIVNRPTVTTGTCTVRTGNFDLENGYANTTTTGPGGGSGVNYPQSLIRIGTADPHFDLEFGPPSLQTSTAGGPRVTGSSDVNMGAKYELGYSTRWLYGVNGEVTFPTGTQAFTAGGAQFTGNFNWGYTVNSIIGLDGSLSFNSLSGFDTAHDAQSYFAFVPSLEITASLPGPAEFFGEYAYFSQAGLALGSKSLFDFGYVRDVGEHVQFDVEYGFSPTLLDGQRQHYIGAGASFML
jgi:opacity protein-like surface antigen